MTTTELIATLPCGVYVRIRCIDYDRERIVCGRTGRTGTAELVRALEDNGMEDAHVTQLVPQWHAQELYAIANLW